MPTVQPALVRPRSLASPTSAGATALVTGVECAWTRDNCHGGPGHEFDNEKFWANPTYRVRLTLPRGVKREVCERVGCLSNLFLGVIAHIMR